MDLVIHLPDTAKDPPLHLWVGSAAEVPRVGDQIDANLGFFRVASVTWGLTVRGYHPPTSNGRVELDSTVVVQLEELPD